MIVKQYVTSILRCPNWTCSGSIYLKVRKGDEFWKAPDFNCDDCHTVWKNSEADRIEKEESTA